MLYFCLPHLEQVPPLVNSNLKSYREGDLGSIIPSLAKLAMEQPNPTWPKTGNDVVEARVI